MTDQIIYCSGPMFSVGDKWEQANVAAVLEGAGYKTYLPQRDGLEVGNLMALLLDPQIGTQLGLVAMAIVRRVVFSLDVYNLIHRCTAVVFNLDGRVPDEGSVVETSMAYAAGKPIVIYKTTPITMLAGEDNPMISGLSSTWTVVDDTVDIVPALQARFKAMGDDHYTYIPPQNIKFVITMGEAVSNPDSDLRQILKKIGEAPTGEEALKEAKALLEWAKTSTAFQNAFGNIATWKSAAGAQQSAAF